MRRFLFAVRHRRPRKHPCNAFFLYTHQTTILPELASCTLPHLFRDVNMPFEPIQTSSCSTDLFQRRQEIICGTYFQNNGREGGNDYSSKYVDSLLAKEFTSLTAQERSKYYEEIHGVSDCVDETPVFVENCLLEFDEELSSISLKTAYDIAEQQNKAYVTDAKFRLMFLRATCFDPRKAAARLVAFFEGKLRFFGQDTLIRQLRAIWTLMTTAA